MKLEDLSVRCNIRLCLPMILSFSCLRTLKLTDEGHSFSSSETFSLSKLSNLRYLRLSNLGGSSFPELPLILERLDVVDMYAKVEQLPDLSSFKQLKDLRIEKCTGLQSLGPLPPHLQRLLVKKCSSLQSLGPLPPHLERVQVDECSSLQSLGPLPPHLESLSVAECRSLQSLGPLPPHLEWLSVAECRSLQDVADLSMLKKLWFLWFTGCSSLKLISLKESSLSQISNGFGAILPNTEIPEWFNYKSRGRTISFHIPPTFTQDNGFAFWIVYKCKNPRKNLASKLRVVITNKTEGITINHHIHAPITDRVGEVLSSVDCWMKPKDMSVKSGDRIEVEFQNELVSSGGEVKVKMCGVHVTHKY